MTEPTDAEIDALLRPFYESDDAAEMEKYDDRLTARAVLAKWGTPQPTQAQAGAVPLTDERLDAAVEAWFGSDNNYDFRERMRAAIDSSHGIKGGQHG